jgi:hypothetical protein
MTRRLVWLLYAIFSDAEVSLLLIPKVEVSASERRRKATSSEFVCVRHRLSASLFLPAGITATGAATTVAAAAVLSYVLRPYSAVSSFVRPFGRPACLPATGYFCKKLGC